MTINWADLGTLNWNALAAIGNIIAAVGTAGALIVAARAYRSQINEVRTRQAARVTYRVTRDLTSLHMRVDNHSDLPIYDVWFSIVAETERLLGGENTWGPNMLEANSHRETEVNFRTDLTGSDLVGVSGEYHLVARAPSFIKYEDAASRGWRRDENGKLSEIRYRRLRRAAEKLTRAISWPARAIRARRMRGRLAAAIGALEAEPDNVERPCDPPI